MSRSGGCRRARIGACSLRSGRSACLGSARSWASRWRRNVDISCRVGMRVVPPFQALSATWIGRIIHHQRMLRIPGGRLRRQRERIRRVRAGQPAPSSFSPANMSNPPRPRGSTRTSRPFSRRTTESAASARVNPNRGSPPDAPSRIRRARAGQPPSPRRYVSAKAKSGGWKAAAVADFARSRVSRFCIAPRSLVDSELG